jgi:hypothetical protein
MSDGVIPGRRDACPIVFGIIFDNFILASIDNDVRFLKLKEGGIEIFSNRWIF